MRPGLALGIVVCPDCNRPYADRRLVHDATCPLGRAIDDLSAADRRWFELHPGGAECTRPVPVSERTELELFGAVVMPGATVTITRLVEGVRVRRYHGAYAPGAPA